MSAEAHRAPRHRRGSPEEELERWRGLRRSGRIEEAGERLAAFHPADLAELLGKAEESERLPLFLLLPPEMAAATLSEMEEEQQVALLRRMEDRTAGSILSQMDDDDAADLLGRVGPEEASRILLAMGREESQEVRELLRFGEETAGGVMTREVVAVDSGLTAAEAIAAVRARVWEGDDLHAIFVLDSQRRLQGTVPLAQLLVANPGASIGSIMSPDAQAVRAEVDQEEVARVMAKYNLVVLPVVDGEGRLLGQVTVDDVIDVVEAEVTEDLLRFGGVSTEEDTNTPPRRSVRLRLPWMLVNLATAFLAGSVVGLFRETIQRVVVLAIFMPIVAGQGGNAATQVLAVTIRGLARGEISAGRAWRFVRRQVLVGAVNGLVVGSVVSVAAFIWQENPYLGLVVGIAMWLNMIVAGLVGAFIPLLLSALRIDPAVASSVIVTTFTDCLGFLFLLGLGTALLGYLV